MGGWKVRGGMPRGNCGGLAPLPLSLFYLLVLGYTFMPHLPSNISMWHFTKGFRIRGSSHHGQSSPSPWLDLESLRRHTRAMSISCFQSLLRGGLTLNVGSTIPWDDVPDWIKWKKWKLAEHPRSSFYFVVCPDRKSFLQTLQRSWPLPRVSPLWRNSLY